MAVDNLQAVSFPIRLFGLSLCLSPCLCLCLCFLASGPLCFAGLSSSVPTSLILHWGQGWELEQQVSLPE